MYQGAVFFDYDGTLVDETCQISSPTAATFQALEKLKKNHYLTALCTGRAKSYLPPNIISAFDCYITSNGACAEINNQIIYNNSIEPNILKKITLFFQQNEINYMLESRDSVYCYDMQEELMAKMIDRFQLPTHAFRPMEQLNDSNINKIIATFDKMEKLHYFREVFGDKFEAVIQHENKFGCDITKKGITKAFGVQAVTKYLNLDIKNTYAFGDGENDLQMFQLVGTGIAMKNHASALKPYLTYVTGSTKEEGIYHGLKKYQLI